MAKDFIFSNRRDDTVVLRRILFWLCLVNGALAVVFGGLMMAFPVDTPLGLSALLPMMGRFPFQDLFFRDLFWSGLALACCNGIMNLAAVPALFRKSLNGARYALFAGVLLIAWCVLENIFLFNFAAVFYLVVGIIQVVLSTLLMNRQKRERKKLI